MNLEVSNYRRTNPEELREQWLSKTTSDFIAFLERCANDPENCSDERFAPYVEPFRLLRGNSQQLKQFFSVLMNESDPRHDDYEFVLNVCERHSVQIAMLWERTRDNFFNS
jgi:hypothetical protein